MILVAIEGLLWTLNVDLRLPNYVSLTIKRRSHLFRGGVLLTMGVILGYKSVSYVILLLIGRRELHASELLLIEADILVHLLELNKVLIADRMKFVSMLQVT